MSEAKSWFVGESEMDPGEWGFDGTVWEPPTEKELAEYDAAPEEERLKHPDPECYLVAEGIRDERYAHMMSATTELIEACKAAQLALRSGPSQDKDYSYELGLLKAALDKALKKGGAK